MKFKKATYNLPSSPDILYTFLIINGHTLVFWFFPLNISSSTVSLSQLRNYNMQQLPSHVPRRT